MYRTQLHNGKLNRMVINYGKSVHIQIKRIAKTQQTK